MAFFNYGETEVNHLKSVCPHMAAVIDRVGMLKRSVKPDLFRSLISGIVSQQISTKAAITVFSRLEDLVGEVNATNVLKRTDEDIQRCGLSYRKVSYIKGVCEAVRSGGLNLKAFHEMSDEQVIAELVKLNGIGVWSAEMFLIFSLQRPDVLSYGDLVIRKSLMRLHGLDDLSKKDFEIYKRLYSPYGSVASLYLWRLADEDGR